MVVSDDVLSAEGRVNARLTGAYRRLKQIEQEDDPHLLERELEQAIEPLDDIVPLLAQVRMIMRAELGITVKPSN
jgi:hypothetical protein